jgi:protein TonB
MALIRHRQPAVFALVLLTHGAALWALQSGLQRLPQDLVTPAEMLVEITPMEAPPAPPATPVKPSKVTPVAPLRPALPTPAPTPAQVAEATPVPAPVTAVAAGPATPSTPAAVPAASANAVAAAAPAPAPPAVQLPSSDADYLHNPKPAYPAMSRRLGETGKVVVRTLIGTDGVAQQAEVLRSSGFERLDRAAVETALKWRYVPGKRAGIPEAMWFNVPLVFVLD